MKQIFFGPLAKEEYHFLIYDRTDAKPIYIENAGYTPPNSKYCVRRTENEYFVFEYVISGKGYLEIDGAVHELHAGDVYCVEPGYGHAYYADEKEPFEKIWINFFSDLFVDIFRAYGISGKFVFKNIHCLYLFEQINQISKTSNYSNNVCYPISSLLFQIVCLLATDSEQNPVSEIADATKRLLDDALFSNVSIEDIADQLHVSKMHIMREFSKAYNGETPYSYLLTSKIEIAKRFLLNTNMQVTEISDKLAFNEPQYFSRIFKKKTGLSPNNFRKQGKK